MEIKMSTITFGGKKLELESKLPTVGQKAPGFLLVTNDFKTRQLSDYAGKTLVIASVPSLDTPVCDLEGRRFNQEAAKLGDKVRVAVVSCDLPFAQARWMETASAGNLETLSDYKRVDFGVNYGVLIKEMLILARAVFVVNPEGVLVYEQLVPELSSAPDYAPVLEAVKKTL